ncbi:MAG: SulP family inorganic anion transporter [Pirellulales bacterium]
MKAWLPIFEWLPRYEIEWLRADLIAGITLAAYLIPAGLGDASLANLPPEAGLYACMFAGLIYWLFCSSRQTAITVTSAISLLVGSSLGELAGGDAGRFGALAAGTALVTGSLYFIGWLAKAGVVVNFVSETVLVGFKCGIALVIASTQLPKLFGFKGTHGDFWERTRYFFSHVNETNRASLLVGLGALLALVLGKFFLKNRPVALFVVIAGIVIASTTDLSSRGVKMLDEVPQGLPPIGLPAVKTSDLNELLPLAMACFLLGAVETAAIGRMFALKHGYRFDPNQEFLALAGANAAAGLGQGFPVSGGMSQSLVNESGGARTPLSGLVAAFVTLIVALSLTGMLRNLPQPVLAAIVLMAVLGLFNVSALKRLWQFSHAEFGIAAVALLGVLGSGILRGVLIGAVLSLVLLLRRGSRPHTTELGRVQGTDYFADRVRHPENERVPGVFVFRCDGPLLFFNVDYVRDRFVELLAERGEGMKLAIFFLGTTPTIDLAGAELLVDLHHTLKDQGMAFHLAEARGGVRDTLIRAGYVDHGGTVEANQTVAAVLRSWSKTESSPSPSLGNTP